MQSKISFNNLYTFVITAETLSFQDAAVKLHVTPSAVSHQIRSLESLLGYTLFDRLDKSVRLTGLGRQLYSEIREPFRQIYQASDKALRGSEDCVLSLSVAPVFATRWLLPRLKGFYEKYPEISLSVSATPDLVDFRSDPSDAAIRLGSGVWENTVTSLLFYRRVGVVCSPALLRRKGGAIPIEKIADQVLIHNASMKGLWKQWFDSIGVVENRKITDIEVANTAQVLEAIDAGDAVGLVDLSFIGAELNSRRLVLVSNHTLTGTDGYFLTYPEEISSRRSLQLFKEWILSEVEAEKR